MEGLKINTIPNLLLARILVQLQTLPPNEYPDFVDILSAGLQKYGKTGDLDAFLDYCNASTRENHQEEWLWKHYEIKNNLDWDLANNKKPQQLVGLRFLLSSETARKRVQLTRFGRNTVLDPKCVHYYQGRFLPVDQVLNDTLNYLKKEYNQVDEMVEKFIELRLEKYSRDKFKFQQESNELDNTTYHLMGALMTRYDSTATQGKSPKSWCLYLRDYIKSEDGSIWRVLYDNMEETVTSEQALADIRGIPETNTSPQPSESSKDYRPVYLFYINQDTITPPSSAAEAEAEAEHITLDDYTFDEDDYTYLDETPTNVEENESCMHCGIKDIINDINDMFFCENCSRGVHQLCEEPPILEFEKHVDPWYCRTCCAILNVPVPTPSPSYIHQPIIVIHQNENIAPPSSTLVKRKRDDE